MSRTQKTQFTIQHYFVPYFASSFSSLHKIHFANENKNEEGNEQTQRVEIINDAQ